MAASSRRKKPASRATAQKQNLQRTQAVAALATYRMPEFMTRPETPGLMPLVHWLLQQVRPGTVLCSAALPADLPFAFCQAATGLSSDTLCIVLDAAPAPNITAEAARYPDRALLLSPTEGMDLVSGETSDVIDLLCLAGAEPLPPDLQLSDHAVVLRIAAITEPPELGPRLQLNLASPVTVTFTGPTWQAEADALQTALGTPGAPGLDRVLSALGRDLATASVSAPDPTTETAKETHTETDTWLDDLVTLEQLLQASEAREAALCRDVVQLQRQLAKTELTNAAEPARTAEDSTDLREHLARLETALSNKEHARFLLEEELRSLTHDYYEREYSLELARPASIEAEAAERLATHTMELHDQLRSHIEESERLSLQSNELAETLEAERAAHRQEQATLLDALAQLDRQLRLERRLQAETLANLHRFTTWSRPVQDAPVPEDTTR